MDGGDDLDEEIMKTKKSLEELLVVRRPIMEFSDEEEKADGSTSSGIDEGLSRFAKKMPIFEPKVVESSSGEKPLSVNLDLALYKAKILARNYRFEEAEEILKTVGIEANALLFSRFYHTHIWCVNVEFNKPLFMFVY